ncbi:SDR family NAD(P)-dependent oxidoreductase [Streptomyces sp. NPDC055815]
MGTLDGKVALVSGSGRGIGREVALKLASEGAAVVINDLDKEPAEETVADIVAAGGKAVACVGSVTEEDFAERFVNTAVDSFGGLDIIVNNAGYTWDTVIQKMTDEQWDAILDVHLKAPFRILRAAQPYIKANPTAYHRKVVNVSSVSGVFGNAGQANYSSAKAGVIGLTKTLAKEWGRYKVNVNAVAFGFILTRMTEAVAGDGDATVEIEGRQIKVGVSPQIAEAVKRTNPFGRPGTPAEAAGAIYALCLQETNYVAGQVLNVDGASR